MMLARRVASLEESATLKVSANASGLGLGRYEATVTVDAPGALSSPQAFRVELDVRRPRRAETVVVDDRDEGFYCTPYFWVGHRFCRCKRPGHAGFYLTSGGRAVEGEIARFTPDLPAGRYEVSFHQETPFAAKARFDVRVRHAGGEDVVAMNPSRSRRIGTFDFHEGTDGFVEILAAGSQGLVIADAVVFRRTAQGLPAG